MSPKETGQIQIHTENIFPIIKKAVYSGHEVFLRELISNGLDAIKKRRMASIAGDCSEADESYINIKLDRENMTITISDNGIGMTSNEIKKYINQVAFSSAESFLEKYKQNGDEIIGHFGLGFYSSFMVASNVEIITRSASPESEPVRWTCDGSPNFTLENALKEEPGTDIILHLMEEEKEYIEPSRIKNLIKKYCDFMPVRIQLEGEVLNKQNPLWRKNINELKEEDYIELYRYLYPYQGDPLLWVHLNTDYPYNLQGILYFPRQIGRADWDKGEIQLYCNQVFVSDSIKEIVPRYLLPLKGVIDSPDIPLNVSRSALQTDRRVKSIGNFVAKKVCDKLKQIKSENPEFYAEAWESLGPFVKIGAIEDEKFADQIENLILFGSNKSSSEVTNEEIKDQSYITFNENTYTNLNSYLERITNKSNKKVLYCTDEIAQANALSLWTSQGTEVLKAETVIDTQFLPWLEARHKDVNFVRVDAELDETLSEQSDEICDNEGETKSETLRKIVQEAISNKNVTIQVQSLKGDDSPAALILLPEQMRRINDLGALMEQRLPGLPEHHVLLLNMRHKLVENLIKLSSGSILVANQADSPSQSMALDLARYIYDMAKLGVGGLEASEIPPFQTRTAKLLGSLVEKAI